MLHRRIAVPAQLRLPAARLLRPNHVRSFANAKPVVNGPLSGVRVLDLTRVLGIGHGT